MAAPTKPRLTITAAGLVALALAVVGLWLAVEHGAVLIRGARAAFESPESFREWIDGFGPWAPLAFFLGEVVQVIVAPIPGNVFPPVGAAAFGPEVGLTLSLGGALAGSALLFMMVRRWGRPFARRMVGAESFDRYAELVSSRGGLWLFLVILIPVLPGDTICVLAGLSPISFRRFMVINALGRLPGTALTTYLTSSLLAQPIWVWPVAGGLLLVGLLLVIRYRSRLERWLLREHENEARPG